MKKNLFALCMLLFVCTLALLCSCCAEDAESSVEVIKDSSYFSDYSVEGESVAIKCIVTLKNKSDTAAVFEIYGDFSADKGTLLTDGVLKGTDAVSGDGSFTLRPNEEKTFTVIFSGTFAGTDQKKDRLLPEITVKSPNENR